MSMLLMMLVMAVVIMIGLVLVKELLEKLLEEERIEDGIQKQMDGQNTNGLAPQCNYLTETEIVISLLRAYLCL